MAESIHHRAQARSYRTEGAQRHGKARKYRRHELVATAGGAVLLLVIGVLSAWAHHSLSTPRPVSSDTGAPPPTSGSATPFASQPMRAEMRSWLTRAESSIDALVAVRSDVASPAANNDLAATGAACRIADGAAARMQQHLPSPDPALNTAFQQAINSYHVGLRYCIRGAQRHDSGDILEAAAYIRQATIDLRAAVDILERDLPDSEPADRDVVTI
jgi:hypothetical protein